MTAIRHARTPSNAPLSVARRPAADRGDSLAPSFSRKRTPPQAVALLHRLTLTRRALTGGERSRKFVFQMRGISAIAKCATINKSRKFLDSVGYMLVLINVNINRKMRAQNFIQSLKLAQRIGNHRVFSRRLSSRFAALAFFYCWIVDCGKKHSRRFNRKSCNLAEMA